MKMSQKSKMGLIKWWCMCECKGQIWKRRARLVDLVAGERVVHTLLLLLLFFFLFSLSLSRKSLPSSSSSFSSLLLPIVVVEESSQGGKVWRSWSDSLSLSFLHQKGKHPFPFLLFLMQVIFIWVIQVHMFICLMVFWKLELNGLSPSFLKCGFLSKRSLSLVFGSLWGLFSPSFIYGMATYG